MTAKLKRESRVFKRRWSVLQGCRATIVPRSGCCGHTSCTALLHAQSLFECAQAAVGAPAIGAKLPAQRMATSRGMKHTTTTPSAPCLVAACEQVLYTTEPNC
eukprot:scaffold283083_cov18-Tisochrysis_lutea.AAC.1